MQMGYPNLLWLLFLPQILIHLSGLAIAQPDFLENFCADDKGNYTNIGTCTSNLYTNNSTYGSNLEKALSLISSNTNSTIYGFYNTSVGQNSDTAYALALCRGDVDPVTCGQCVYNSTLKLREIYPNQKDAIGWYELCMLRYSSRSSILKNMDELPPFFMWSLNNVTNAARFNQDLGRLMDGLRTRAAAGGPLRKFATGNISSPEFPIYGLMQCTPNLSEEDCNSCLEWAAGLTPNCCTGRQGGRVITPSCNLRFEVGSFFSEITPTDAAPAPQPISETPANATPPPQPISSETPSDATPPPQPMLVVILFLVLVFGTM